MLNFSREKSFEAIVNTAIDAIVVMDSKNRIRYFNPGAERLLGWTMDEVLGKDMSIIIPERFRAAHWAGVQRFCETKVPKVLGTPFVFLPSLHKDGHEIATNISIATWDEGDEIFFTGIIRDVSVVIEHTERQNLLIKELNHRVKNTLAVITGMIHQTARDARTVDQFQTALEERVIAMSKTHDLLVDNDWSHTTLEDLIRVFVTPFKYEFYYDGPSDVRIRPAIAITIGMALNELVTNCIKYGAWSKKGQVTLTATRREDGRSVFIWKEHNGPPVVEPTRRSFGSTLLERVVSGIIQGEAKMYFEPDGLRYEVVGITPTNVEKSS